MGPIRDAAEASQALEACLLRQMIESSGVFKGNGMAGERLRTQMFVEALADAVEKGGGLGLAKIIEQSLPVTKESDLGLAEGEPATESNPMANVGRALIEYGGRAEALDRQKTQVKPQEEGGGP
jgi:Rod binding domain-containing protein